MVRTSLLSHARTDRAETAINQNPIGIIASQSVLDPHRRRRHSTHWKGKRNPYRVVAGEQCGFGRSMWPTAKNGTVDAVISEFT
jgi:hypothetical protein